MSQATHVLDLASLSLVSGEGRRLTLEVPIADLDFGGQRYEARPRTVPARIDVSRMTGGGYALKLAFQAGLSGPCMRCLRDAAPMVEVQAREVSVPGEAEELASPYVQQERLALADWAHDAFALAAPAKVLCREDCLGLCPVCAADLNEAARAGLEHTHERASHGPFAKLSELRFE